MSFERGGRGYAVKSERGGIVQKGMKEGWGRGGSAAVLLFGGGKRCEQGGGGEAIEWGGRIEKRGKRLVWLGACKKEMFP